MKISSRKTKQQGAALMVMLAIVVLGFAYLLVSHLNPASGVTAINRDHNAKILNQAKQALVGYVAQRAAMMNEDNPGRLPCPEGAAFIATADEGIAAPRPGAPTCASVGRLPWRTLGLDKLVDAKSEPLWYVVGPTWRLTNSSTSLVINSNTPGDTVVDGQQVVALIIAPGAAMNVQASAGCVAHAQTRSTPSPTMDARDYLECFDAATLQFVTTAPSTSFNDQVVRITTADVLPAIEAAIAYRFERQIAPAMRSAYSNSDAANPNPAWPTTNAVLPFGVPFGDPQTSNLKGVTATFQGLMPLNRFQTRCTCAPAPCECTPTACTVGIDCDAAFVSWTGAATMSGADVYSPSCSSSPTQVTCDFYVRVVLLGLVSPPSVSFTLQASAQNVGMGLRQFQTEATMPGVLASARTLSGTLNPSGSASITLNAQADTSDAAGGGLVGNLLCGITGALALTLGCAQDTITVPISVLVDHAVINPNDATLGWFRRNRWHEVSYYAVAPNIAPSGTGSCVTGASCLSANFLAPSGAQRGLIVIAGQSLSGQARPPAAVSDWLEGENAVVDNVFAVRNPGLMVNRSFNDRIAVIDRN